MTTAVQLATPPSPAQARAATRLRASTFALACRMLPLEVRDDVYLLYVFFRRLDDLVDHGSPDAALRVDAVARWAENRSGVPTPEVRIVAELAARRGLPREPIADFCAGLRQDLEREPLRTEADLDRYCYRVAGTVGLVMAELLGVHDRQSALPAAAALGMAMQRTNILRDIDEDRDRGRIYLAEETLERFGPAVPGQRAELLRDQIARADALYESGLAGIGQLRHGRRAVAAAAAMYREILREIERRGLGARGGRAVVGRTRRLAVGVRAASALG